MVGGDFLSAGWALVGFELAREHEEAIVAHEVQAWLEQDQLHGWLRIIGCLLFFNCL